MAVLLVHGYNATGRSWEILEPELNRYGVYTRRWSYREMNGPITGLIGARLCNRRRARELARVLASDLVEGVVAHSNGALVADYACELAPVRVPLLLIHPALDKDHTFAAAWKRIRVYCAPGDAATRWARFLLFHPWGAMGAFGYIGKDTRVRNRAYVTEGYGLDEHSLALQVEWASRLAAEMACFLKREDIKWT